MYKNVIIFLSIISVHFAGMNAEHKHWDKEVDFIVVGAGAAGAAVANRLSEGGSYTVLLLEAGKEPLKVTKIPYFGAGPLGGDMDWKYKTESQEYSCQNYEDKKIGVPRGKSLGGSTAINGMIVTRGNKHDYDEWESLGNKGWSYDDVLPFFKKLEDYDASFIHEDDAKYHGKGGPVKISRPSYTSPIKNALLEASSFVGYSVIDYNAEKQTGFFNPVFTLNDSSRWSTYDAYLKPILQQKNFKLVTNAFVTRANFDHNLRAISVVFHKDGSEFTATCRKEIILSAGAYNSPQLLMISGIGPSKTLTNLKIPVVADLPGVGQNLRDHVMTFGITYTFPEHMGVNHKYHVNAETMEMWESKKQGPLTIPVGNEFIAFVNTKYADSNKDYPDLEIFTLQIPGRDLGLKKAAVDSILQAEDDRSTITFFPTTLRPKSIGYVTLNSSNPYDSPVIQPNFLKEDYDVDVMLEGVRFIHRMMETEPVKKLGATRLNRKALGCETLDDESDDYYKCLIRHYTSHVFHPMGTCKMGVKEDSMSVVDSRLRVYGVKNLRVVDMSISPTAVTAHTMIPAIMIGEKGAHMILEDWADIHEEL